MNIVYGICVSFFVVFFLVAFMARKKTYPFVAVFFIIFIGLTYFFMVEVLGLPRPLNSRLPFIAYQDGSSQAWLDFAAPKDNKYVYLLIEQNHVERLYIEDYDPDALAQLQEAYRANHNRWGFKVSVPQTTNPKDLLGYQSQVHVDLGQFQSREAVKTHNENDIQIEQQN